MLATTGYRENDDSDAFALPVSASSDLPPLMKVDMKYFHFIQGHAGEHLLKVTADRLRIELEGEVQPCDSCSMAKGSQKGVSSGAGPNRSDIDLPDCDRVQNRMSVVSDFLALVPSSIFEQPSLGPSMNLSKRTCDLK